MATKADFNAEEWETIVQAPALAALRVIAAQRGGTIRESVQVAKVYSEAREQHGGDLIGEITKSAPTIDKSEFTSREDLAAQTPERIRAAVALVESKFPDELDAYRQFAMTVAQRAAEADKSGGVLGVGGERVSDSERAALAEVAEALGTTPPA
jgi:hypothetical protein